MKPAIFWALNPPGMRKYATLIIHQKGVFATTVIHEFGLCLAFNFIILRSAAENERCLSGGCFEKMSNKPLEHRYRLPLTNSFDSTTRMSVVEWLHGNMRKPWHIHCEQKEALSSADTIFSFDDLNDCIHFKLWQSFS